MSIPMTILDASNPAREVLSAVQGRPVRYTAKVQQVLAPNIYQILLGGHLFAIQSDAFLQAGQDLQVLASRKQGRLLIEIIPRQEASAPHHGTSVSAGPGMLSQPPAGQAILESLAKFRLPADNVRVQRYMTLQHAVETMARFPQPRRADALALADSRGALDPLVLAVLSDVMGGMEISQRLKNLWVASGQSTWPVSVQDALDQLLRTLQQPGGIHVNVRDLAETLLSMQQAIERAVHQLLVDNRQLSALNAMIEKLQTLIRQDFPSDRLDSPVTVKHLHGLLQQSAVDIAGLLDAVESLPPALRQGALEEMLGLERSFLENHHDLLQLRELYQQSQQALDHLSVLRLVNLTPPGHSMEAVYMEWPGYGRQQRNAGKLRVLRNQSDDEKRRQGEARHRVIFLLHMDKLGDVLGDFRVLQEHIHGGFHVVNRRICEYLTSGLADLMERLEDIGYQSHINIALSKGRRQHSIADFQPGDFSPLGSHDLTRLDIRA